MRLLALMAFFACMIFATGCSKRRAEDQWYADHLSKGDNSEQERASAEVEKLGGKVKFEDRFTPGNPYVGVDLILQRPGR